MFVFEDLLLIDPMGLKEVLAKVDRKVLTVALKGTSEQLRNQILGCMSQRGAEMLREDMEALGPGQDQGSGGGAAADHRRGAATRIGRRDEPEGHRRGAVCRLRCCLPDEPPARLARRLAPGAEPTAPRRAGRGGKSQPDLAEPTARNWSASAEQQRPRGPRGRGARRRSRPGRNRAGAELQPVIERLARSIQEIGRAARAPAARGRRRHGAAGAGHRPPVSCGASWPSIPTPCAGWCWRRSRSCRAQEISRVQVHPSHAALVTSCLQQSCKRSRPVEVIADPSREPGTVIFETDARQPGRARWIRNSRRSSAAWRTACGGSS